MRAVVRDVRTSSTKDYLYKESTSDMGIAGTKVTSISMANSTPIK